MRFLTLFEMTNYTKKNNKIPNIAIAILAAGSSSRMGQPKQLLKWGNETLISNAIKNALSTKAQDVILILGANYDNIYQEAQNNFISIIKNDNWQDGLASSIAKAAQYSMESGQQIDGLLITLADQPLITSEYLQNMINNFESGANQIIATSYEANKKGVPALFDKDYFSELAALTGDDGAKRLLKKYISNVSVTGSEVINLDIDTEADYQNLINLQSSFKSPKRSK